MSLLNKASFLVTPNGYKEDKLYAAIPTNGDGDMTVTRATTATRVNEAGLIELVPYNLLLRSQEFDNAYWLKVRSSITANAVIAPDGTLTSDKLVEDTSTNNHYFWRYIGPVRSGGIKTFSVFVKKAERSVVRLECLGVSGFFGVFNLDTLTVTAGGLYGGTSPSSTSITPLANDWYRISISGVFNISNSNSTLIGRVFLHNGTSENYLGDGTSGLYIWGAQLVEGSSALTYQKTVDRLDIPRIDYTGGGCPSILLEPQRTNLVTYSEDFNDASWQHNANIKVTSSSELAPNGNLEANLIEYDGSGYSFIRKAQTAPSTATLSVFAKKGNWRYLGLRNFQTSGTHTVFDFDTETFTNTASGQTASFEIFSNGWYRVKVTQPSPSQDLYGIAITNSSGSEANATGGEVANVHLWGAQLEEGSYPTSYIPTTTATVTRNADVCVKTGISDLLNPSEGTFYAEISALANDSTSRILSLNDGAANNVVQIALSNASNQIRLDIYGQGANYRALVTVSDATENHKVLIKWGASGIFGFIDGDKYTFFLAAGTGSGIPTALNRINFSTYYGAAAFYGKCKGVQVYKTALSDPQCQALTTL